MSRALQTINSLLNAYPTRVVLSIAIIASIIPAELGLGLRLTFGLFFGTEVLLRLTVLGHQLRQGKRAWGAAVVLALDLAATISFLPFEGQTAEVLRLGRVARLMLLLAYWGPLVRDFILIALQRERLSQILLVGGLSALLTGAGAAALRVIDTTGADIDGDGAPDASKPNLAALLWWSFRQVQDPGNLVANTHNNLALLLLSLALTAAGLLLMAFLIGIGATLVEDLMAASRQRAVGLRQHIVLLNLGEHNWRVIGQIRDYFSKQVWWNKVALQGDWPQRPGFLDALEYRSFHYRRGHAAEEDTLLRLDVPHAQNVAVLSAGPTEADDARTVAAAMSVRRLTADAWVVAELNRPSNIPAALRAGTTRMVPVPARRLASLVLAQEVTSPGCGQLVEEMVSLRGREIYTSIFGEVKLSELPPNLALGMTFSQLQQAALHSHEALLIGLFQEEGVHRSPWIRGVAPLLNPQQDPPSARGLIAIAPQYDNLQNFSIDLARGRLAAPALNPLPLPNLLARPKPPVRRALVLGFHDDAVEMVAELLLHYPALEVTIVGDNEPDRAFMRESFLAERMESGARFEVVSPKQVQLVNGQGEANGVVHLRVADRFGPGMFVPGDASGRVGSAFDYDAAIFLADALEEGAQDAATVLSVLKLLEATPGPTHRLSLVVAEIEDGNTGRLLQEQTSASESPIRFSYVHTRELREQILTHAFFVPGLAPVLHNLVTRGRDEIVTYTARGAEGAVSFGELVGAFAQQRPRAIPLAISTRDGELYVSPPSGQRFSWSEVDMLYCLTKAC